MSVPRGVDPAPPYAIAPGSPQERALRHVAGLSEGGPLDPDARPTMNFHPDRYAAGVPILERMAADGVYRSQFVTGTGNGGLTARPGGDRWRWESGMFAGAYDTAPHDERPVYAALHHRRQNIGSAPRFGSAHFRLTAATLARATFCYPDSSTDPTAFGVAHRFALFEMSVADALDHLDDYVEAHIHGPVLLDRDVEALVLDPCYRETPVAAAAARLPCPVEWHGGFRLTVDRLRLHPEFRGPRIVAIGAEIAVDGLLDPAIIGAAVRTGEYDPQDLKKVWHHLARFGAPDRT
ncbi:DUF3626 domain-containing protein [Nocardia takedensis]